MSRADVLVDADWVEAHLDDPKVVLVEVDEDTSAYERNHIRNAIRIDWADELQDKVRYDFIGKEDFEKRSREIQAERRKIRFERRPESEMDALFRRERDEEEARFAQALGLVFALAGVVGFALGSGIVALTATAMALIAAFLNAAFGICLGCELYLLYRRTFTRRAPARHKEGSA